MWFLKRSLLFVLIVSLCLFTFGCGDDDDDNDSNTAETTGDSGDSGDSTTYDNTMLDGDHLWVTFAADDISDISTAYNQVLDLSYDGDGNFTWSIAYDPDDETGSGTGAYTIETDGQTTISDTDTVGITSQDGYSFAPIDTTVSGGVDDDAYFGLDIEKSSDMDEADFDGDFVMCSILTDFSNWHVDYFEMKVNGDGTWSGTCYDDYSGSGSSGDSISGTYTIDEDGAIYILVQGAGKELYGQLSPDGNFYMMHDKAAAENGFFVGVKQSDTGDEDESLLDGVYQANFFSGYSDGSCQVTRRELDVDGSGTFDATIVSDSDGESGSNEGVAYTIDENGLLEIASLDLYGIVSSDGGMMVVAKTGDSEGDVEFAVGIRMGTE